MVYEKEISYYKKLLKLEKEEILVKKHYETAINQDNMNKRWIIEFHDVGIIFTLIHEFGHIFISHKFKYPYLVRKPPKFKEIDINIWDIHNTIIDSFVNFNLSLFTEIYQKYHEYLLAIFTRNVFPKNPIDYLSGYIEAYSGFNFILQTKEKKKLFDYYNNFIYRMGYIALGFIQKDLETLNFQLKQFNNIKDTKKLEEIKDFDLNTLKLLKLNDLLNNFNLIYPVI